jgi:hypothetical protein
VWTSAGTIVLIEVVIAVRAGLPRRDVILNAALGGLLGLMVILLRLLLH